MNQLQKSLRLNAIFSGLTGIDLIIFNQPIAQLFGSSNTTFFWVLGLGLIVFAGSIVYEIYKQRYKAIQWIIIQDFLWVLGSIVILILQPFEISRTGNYIIITVALIVLLMGLNQLKALTRSKQQFAKTK